MCIESFWLLSILMSSYFDTVAAETPSSYQIVYPIQVTSQGEELSHISFFKSTRRRRAVHRKQIYLNITGDSLHFNLKLKSNTQLLAPGFKVYLRNHDNKTQFMNTSSSDPDIHDKSCLYTGNVTSYKNGGQAAVSLCHGVTGVLRLPGEDYVIEPLPEHLIINNNNNNTNSQQQQPHIIYKTTKLPHQEFRQHQFNHFNKDYSDISHNSYSTASSIYRTAELKELSGITSTRLKNTVETLVVADSSMLAKHGQKNITTYILSIFNIVSKLFEDNSLGKPVEILLVGLVLLKDNEPGLHITHHADYTLNSFCQWQSTLSDSTGRRHDHAILLTGLDICSYKNSPCDTLGFAPINGMCNPLRSCIMTEDSGLATAFTVTHELGHNFGMFHDGEGNECKSQGGNIMAPTLTGNNGIFQWSSCSRDYFLRFLNTIQSTCLSDRPNSIAEFKFPEKLPGELYDATTQCKWLFGNDAQACLYDFGDNKMCQSLWCYRSNHMCETKFLPAAEGTECGLGMWCRQSRCERKVLRNKDVDGGWSAWTSWTICSRTCGGGIQERSRKCNNPKPEYNGKSCLGDSQMYKLCNIQECGDNKDYRQQQCEDYNRKLFRGWYYSWKKYKKYIQKVEDQCKLYCQAEDYNFFFALNNKVKDGTLCSDFSDKRCIKGSCKDYGCDLVFDSETHHDRCGVCQGDNSTCSLITGVFTNQLRQNAYHHIITLPIGARKIKIEEVKPSSNYLVLRNKYGEYYLNGNRQISTPGVYNIGGSQFQYDDTDQGEKLESNGPLKENIVLEMLSRGVNYGIKYEYSLDKRLSRISMDEYQYSYRWNTILSTCSNSCAGGMQNVSIECMRSDSKVVNDLNCDVNIKPSTQPRQCSKSPCPARWETSEWGECSKNCGGGKQKRTIRCWQMISQDKDIKIKPRFCKHIPKQSKKRYCNQHDCKPRWLPAKWSQCSVTCGQGHKTREVTCKKKTVKGNVEISDTHCKDLTRPSKRKHCYRRGSCLLRLNERVISYQWLISSWGKCSATCDKGIKRRTYRCSRVASRGHYRRVSDYYCRNVQKPRNTPLVTHCLLPPCQKSIWKTGPWTQCSVSCGEGFQLRTVRCIDNIGNTTINCPASKPDSRKTCQQPSCFSSSQGQSSCSDEFQWCHLVPVHKICSHSYYGSKCCQSCRGHS